MEFRYVIQGRTYGWQRAEDVSIAKMQYVKETMNEQFGNDWYIEWRHSND